MKVLRLAVNLIKVNWLAWRNWLYDLEEPTVAGNRTWQHGPERAEQVSAGLDHVTPADCAKVNHNVPADLLDAQRGRRRGRIAYGEIVVKQSIQICGEDFSLRPGSKAVPESLKCSARLRHREHSGHEGRIHGHRRSADPVCAKNVIPHQAGVGDKIGKTSEIGQLRHGAGFMTRAA